MTKVNLNGVCLTSEALDELRYMQLGVDHEEDTDAGEPNAGLNSRLVMIDETSRFLISLDIDEKAGTVLRHLKNLGYIRDALNALRLPDEKATRSHA